MQCWQKLGMVTMGRSPSPTILLISECDKNNSCANICCKPTGQFAYVGDAELQILRYLKGGIPDQRRKESKNATRIEVTELVGGWNLHACQQRESRLESEQFWQRRILVRMYQSCWRPLDVLSLLSSQDRLEMLVSVGAKSLRGHQVRGHQVQVHGCEKKFGQKSDVSLVLGSSARHTRDG